MKSRKTQCRFVAVALSVVATLYCSCSRSLSAADFSELSPKIMDTLDNIKSYEMTVSYSERVKGLKALLFRIKSDSSSTLKFKSPNLLYIKATNTTIRGTGDTKTVQKITLYSTFDGKHQKCRSVLATNNTSVTNSVAMDLSINSPDQPFNGWNPKGFGLSEGKDYIGTIRDMLPHYDFVTASRKQDVAEFKGTFNVEKFAATLAKTMTPEGAKAFAEISGSMVKELRIRVDTKRHLVVGYTQIDILAERTCSFENIKINQGINDEVFTFQSLPEEEFRDITETVRKSRELSQQLLTPNKPDAGDGK